MSLKPGTKLGPYEILSQIGAGGMGEVYKGRDTRLDRIVAIKVLHAHLASNPELRERFEREARTIANLKHEHICTLYDVGHQDGVAYLVLEYLEGESLAERLKKGPLPLDQALQYAIELASALDTAHRQGFTHRDIKPGNIMLTKSGSKLLDFGLAKLKQEVAKDIPLDSQAPTPPLGAKPGEFLTVRGAVMGTLQYMAPEQAEGKTKEIDARTDIFSFGIVVYEMVTGQKAFQGQTHASLISSILKDTPPPISSLAPMTPPALDRVIKKCLAKDPEKRWHSVADLQDELQWIREGGGQAAISAPSGTRRAVLVGIGCILLGAVAARLAFRNTAAPTGDTVAQLAIPMAADERLGTPGYQNPVLAISPDGSKIVYVANRGGKQQLYLRPIDSLEEKAIPGTENGASPFFSPDGQWIGFFQETKLKKLPITGGQATVLATAPNPRNGYWTPDGTIVFTPTAQSAIFKVSENGGTPEIITKPDASKGQNSDRWAEILPGDKAVIFTSGVASSGWLGGQIVIQPLPHGERRVLIEGGSQPRYMPTGHLIFVRSGTLMAVPFDLKRLELTGAPVPIVEGVEQSTNTGAAQYSVSSQGTLVYLPGSANLNRTMVWVDRKGIEEPLPAPPRAYRNQHISPDGRRILLAIEGMNSDVWIYDIPRNTLTRLTFEANNSYPVWGPDAKRIFYQSNKAGPPNLFWKPADGTGTEERLTSESAGVGQNATSWSPDGQVLAFVEQPPATGSDIWLLSMQGDRKPRPFLQTPFNETMPSFSPDGRWLAYTSDESGRNEVYVRPYPGPGEKWQISSGGGTEPLWSKNGKELCYRIGDKMMAVGIGTQPSFSAGTPVMLFEHPYLSVSTNSNNYDVTPDGQRFLMVKAQEQPPTQINVVLNWFEELKKKVPVK